MNAQASRDPERRCRSVLMTADTIGGVWTYAMELARGLAQYDVRILLASMGMPVSNAQRAEVEAMGNVDLVESGFQLEWVPGAWPDVDRAGDWLLALMREYQPDVVHLNGYSHAAMRWSAPVLVVAHSCVLSWWEAVKAEAAPPMWDEYRRRVTNGLHAADLVVAPTKAMLASVQKHYGPLSRTRVIMNGRDASGFAPGRKEHFILAAGRLGDEAKNIATLALAAEGLPWQVLVAGRVSDPTGHRALPPNVCHLGFLESDAMQRWINRASIYCLPARYEPFGLSVLEAALAGCALVLGDIESLREIWRESALYVKPNDSAALHRVLQRLIQNPAECEMLGRKARERALLFSAERCAEAYYGAYCELLTRTGVHSRA